MMKEAVLQGLKMKYLQAPLEAWYDAFAEASQDDLTAAEIEELRESYNKIIANAGSYLKGMEDITGLSFEDNAGRSATRRGLESISQDSADLLNGKFSTMLFYMDKIEQRSGHVLDALIPALSHLAEIRDNTRYCRKLEAMERYLSRLATIVDNGIDIRR